MRGMEAALSNDACNVIQYCDLASGQCLPAKNCQVNPSTDPEGEGSCEYGENDYCAFGSCWCDESRGGGVCLPRVPPCGSCSADIECGNDPNFYADYTAACAAVEGAAGPSSKVCVPLKATGCPHGYVPSADSATMQYCLPGGGACGAPGACTQDSDCDPTSANPICDTSRGVCTPACTFDYLHARSPDCPPNQICHVDPALLTSGTNPNYGKGVCGPPCDQSGGYVCPTTPISTDVRRGREPYRLDVAGSLPATTARVHP